MFNSPFCAFKENRFPQVIMSSDCLSRAHEQKYWDGATVPDLTDFFMMLWKLVSPSLPGAGSPPHCVQ